MDRHIALLKRLIENDIEEVVEQELERLLPEEDVCLPLKSVERR